MAHGDRAVCARVLNGERSVVFGPKPVFAAVCERQPFFYTPTGLSTDAGAPGA